jgi:hypothetical protein
MFVNNQSASYYTVVWDLSTGTVVNTFGSGLTGTSNNIISVNHSPFPGFHLACCQVYHPWLCESTCRQIHSRAAGSRRDYRRSIRRVVEINHDDAVRLGIQPDNGLVEVASRRGR